MYRKLILILAVVSLATSALAQQPGADPLHNNGGSLGCTLTWLRMIKLVGDICFRDKHAEIKSVVDEAISRTEAFAKAYGVAGEHHLNFAEQQIRHIRNNGMLCVDAPSDDRSVSFQFYKSIVDRGADALRLAITKMFANPARPEWWECI